MTTVIFIIGISLLILVHEFGHFLAAKLSGLLVYEFGFGFPPRLFKKKIGETVYSINLLPFGGFVKIHGERSEDDEGGGVPPRRSFAHQSTARRAFILVSGVLMNFLVGWIILSSLYLVGVPSSVVVADVVPDTPAARAGIVKGDVFPDFSSGKEFTDFVARSEGKEITLVVRRGEERISVKVTPRVDPPAGQGRLGIAFVESGLPKKPLLQAFGTGFQDTLSIIGMIVKSFGGLIASVFTGAPALENLVGPVGIFKVASESARYGLANLVHLIALISLNLAVLNVLPFPALDGGRLLFLLIEKIKGSPLSPKREQIANAIGFSLLIALMVVITVRDVVKLF